MGGRDHANVRVDSTSLKEKKGEKGSSPGIASGVVEECGEEGC